jgi:hypothetical protein
MKCYNNKKIDFYKFKWVFILYYDNFIENKLK